MNQKIANNSLFNDPQIDALPSTDLTVLRWAGIGLLLFGMAVIFQPKKQITAPTLPSLTKNDRFDDMVQNLSPLIESYHGEVGIYIKDLKTGQTFERNADTSFVSASLIKLPIMVATCQAISEGLLKLDTKLKYKEKYRRGGSGRLKWIRSGHYFRVSDLIFTMMTKSDNTATAMLIDRLGYNYLNYCFRNFGLEKTQITPTGMSLASYLQPSKDNYTTPREMGTLLENLYKHRLVNDGMSDLMLEIMKGANSHGRLAQYLPGDWKFARKTGLLRNYCHDVGIVFAPHSDYVICVLTGHNGNYRTAKSFISNVGKKAYEYMGNS